MGNEQQEVTLELTETTRNEEQEVVEELAVTVKGMSEMPFWKHDLKFKAAIALIETIELEDYDEDNVNLYFEQLAELNNVVVGLERE